MGERFLSLLVASTRAIIQIEFASDEQSFSLSEHFFFLLCNPRIEFKLFRVNLVETSCEEAIRYYLYQFFAAFATKFARGWQRRLSVQAQLLGKTFLFSF